MKFDVFNADKSKNYKSKTVVLIHSSAPMKDIKDISIFQTWCKLLATIGFDAFNPCIETDSIIERTLKF